MPEESQIKDSSDFINRIRQAYGLAPDGQEIEPEQLRYVMYTRKSTDEQGKQERSIGDQKFACEQVAEKEGLNVVEFVHEERSAKMSDNRPKFREMLDNILKGKYDAILTWAPDRLARNMKEGGEVIDLLDRGDIKDMKFGNGYYFQNDGAGKMMLGIAFVQAKQFIDTHSLNVKRGYQRITGEGKFYDRPKHGYYKDKLGYPRPDAENWELLRDAFQMRLAKKSLKEIATWLQERSYPLKTKHTSRKPLKVNEKFLSDIFRDPFYAGVLVRGQQVVDLTNVPGFEAVINPEEFDQLVELSGVTKRFTLSERVKEVGSIKADLLRGMVFCASCHRALSTGITPKKSTNGTLRNYFYFRCDTINCKYKGKSVRAKVIMDAVYRFLDTHPMNFERGYEAYNREMGRLADVRDQELIKRLKSLRQQHAGMKNRITAVKDSLTQYKQDDVLRKEFKQDLLKYLDQLHGIESQIKKTEQEREKAKNAIQTFQEFIELFQNLAQHIRNLKNMSDLDFVLKKLFSNFLIDGKKVVQITQNSPFRELCGSPNSENSVMVAPGGIEPPFSP